MSLLFISTNFLSSHTFSSRVLLYVRFIFERLSLLRRETEKERRKVPKKRQVGRKRWFEPISVSSFQKSSKILFSPLSFLVISFLCKFSLQTFLSLPASLFRWPSFFPSQKLMNHSSPSSSSSPSYLSLVMYGFKGKENKVGRRK